MSAKYDKLKALLLELFQMDQPELDFGIYRIMHAKAGEISKFLDDDLLPQVKSAFEQYKSADKGEVEHEIEMAIAAAKDLGVPDPEAAPKVVELRQRLANESVDISKLEGEVYDHLYSFFRRYYSEGDFLSKRVYKEGVYAIPYEGEEVKLHWANADQYYIKTSEYLRDFSFRLNPDADEAKGEDPIRVHFRLRDAAEGEHGNVKEADGKNRVFVLASENFIEEIYGAAGKELVIYFEYRPATLSDWSAEKREGKKKPPSQDDLTESAIENVLGLSDPDKLGWLKALSTLAPTDKKPRRTLLEKQLNNYTKRNTFDYFIHKDLGGFLRRELDFYIKNEVMHLDDIESDTAPRVEQYLSKIKVIRSIAHKITDFLAQLEDFQKKLWLKKKFVTGTHYCIPLALVPHELYSEVAESDARHREWVLLFGIDNFADYSTPLTPEFLRKHESLPVDTINFSDDFCAALLESVEGVDDLVQGKLFLGENSDAARLASKSFANKITCFYSDPPFNLGANADFLYRTDYMDSTWLCMLEGRITAAQSAMATDGLVFVRCDYHGSHLVRDMLEALGYVFK
ncbi:MAG: site-specific DNA-methyltransferase, partial [Acidobacteria bacterium]|nr:site-specific DNA-methyltransferase [Acidobacteriota bacterium]